MFQASKMTVTQVDMKVMKINKIILIPVKAMMMKIFKNVNNLRTRIIWLS